MLILVPAGAAGSGACRAYLYSIMATSQTIDLVTQTLWSGSKLPILLSEPAELAGAGGCSLRPRARPPWPASVQTRGQTLTSDWRDRLHPGRNLSSRSLFHTLLWLMLGNISASQAVGGRQKHMLQVKAPQVNKQLGS